MTYSYGIPGPVIWIMHMIIGLLILYVGYVELNHYRVSQLVALLLIILGVLAILYHGHLYYLNGSGGLVNSPSN